MSNDSPSLSPTSSGPATSGPATIDQYLHRLAAHLAGEDPAVIQDALHDAEEYLRSELLEHPDKPEREVVEMAANHYGTPDEVAVVYRQTEATVSAALALPKRKTPRSKAGGFFAVLSDPSAYSALLYMLASLLSGILFFTITVTGVALSIGLSILIIGLPFFLAFVSVERALALMEGRIVEALLGIRMPRRPRYVDSGQPLLQRIKTMVTDPRSWSTMAYMLLMLPLGVVYFTVAITGTVLSIGLILSPLALLLEPFGIVSDGNVNTWAAPLVFAVGCLLAPALLHLAKKIGQFHGELAKRLLVPPSGLP